MIESLSRIGYLFFRGERKRWRALIHKRSAFSQSSRRPWPLFADAEQFQVQKHLGGGFFESRARNRRHHGERKTRFRLFLIAREDIRREGSLTDVSEQKGWKAEAELA